MSQQLEIYCVNTGEYIPVDGGETLSDLLGREAVRLPFTPICARVNNKAESLNFRVFAPKQVEFLSRNSPSGERTYIRSLCMMLYKAVSECYPEARLRIEHSISHGHYCLLISDGLTVTDEVVGRLRSAMRRLVERNLPFERFEQLTTDVIELFRRQGLDDKVMLLETTHELYTVYYRLDGLCDSYYGALVPSTGHLGVFDLIPYKNGFLLLGPEKDSDSPQKPVAQEKMFRAFTDYVQFNHIIGIRNVGELNRAIEQGSSPMLVNVAEALHEKKIGRISDEILSRHEKGGARIIMIAGPSSSGKTTFTKRLAIQLMTNLLEPQLISLDDYFLPRSRTPRDESGDYDYESLYALDLQLFNQHLEAMLRGEEVELPYYNFTTGEREYRGNRLRLSPDSVLLIEGIHGLNPELTAAVADDMKFKIYVSALTTLSIDDHNWVPTTDNRLLRRIVRDHKYRGTSAAATIRRWPSVRRGEEKWIFPYQENADATFNSSLLFELAVMKENAEAILAGVSHDCVEYGEAYRLRRFLSYFQSIDDSMLSSTSLLREFLGGSSFKY